MSRSLKIRVVSVCAFALAVMVVVLVRRSTAETVTFRIVNAQTGEAVTNVDVTQYRPKSILFEELLELLDWGRVRADKVSVSPTGIAQIDGLSEGGWVTVDFIPETNFGRVFFNRHKSDDYFSNPYNSETVKRGKTNRVTIELTPLQKEAKP